MDVIFRAQLKKRISHDDVKEKLLALNRDPRFKIRIIAQEGRREIVAEILFEREIKRISKILEELEQQNAGSLDEIERSLQEELIRSYQNQYCALENGFFLQFKDSEIVFKKKNLETNEENEYEIINELKVYAVNVFSMFSRDNYVICFSFER